MFLLYCTLGVNCIACGKKTTKQESLRRWNRAERDKRDDCDCKRGGEPRGGFFSSAAHTHEPRRRRRWKTQRQHVHMFGIRTSGQREGGKQEKEGRERKGVVPPTCCRMWLLNKKPQREKKKKKSPYISPACVLPVPAVGWLAGWLAAAAAVRPQHPAERRRASEHWTRCF